MATYVDGYTKFVLVSGSVLSGNERALCSRITRGRQTDYDVSCHTATGRIIPLSLSFQEKRIMRRVYIGALEQPRASRFLYLDISLF